MAKFIDYSKGGLKIPAAYAGTISDKVWMIKDSSNMERFLHLLLLLQYLSVHIDAWELLSGGPAPCPIAPSQKTRMNAVYQYTIDHFSEDISLEKMASIACLTIHSFCKYFKKHTRKTYLTFLNEIRINEACKRIVGNEYDSISSIAYATGFNNTITFNRVFKRIIGICPTDYIRQYKCKIEESG